MRQTLFLIPHQIGGLPVFGVGWVLFALVAFLLIRFVWMARFVLASHRSGEPAMPMGWRGAGEILLAESWMWLIMGAIVVFLIPRLELTDLDGHPVGVAVRGYGAFLMLAAISSISFAAWRAHRTPGLNSEMIFQLVPYTFVGGIVGARLFYLAQYWQDYVYPTWTETLAAAAAFTQGGLVVYGGFIGGFLASCVKIRRLKAPLWKLGDVIVPCIFIGLCFGRLGCLMNGCCFGGTCEPGPLAISFPPGSPVFVEQLLSGELIGIQGDPVEQLDANQHQSQRPILVNSVVPGSLADRAGVQPQQKVVLALDYNFSESLSPGEPRDAARPGLTLASDGQILGRYSPAQIPTQAHPVWATQIVSAIAAAVMFVVLLLVEWWLATKHAPPGSLMLIGFIGYALLRIVLEWLRVDEAGQFGTGLSISQWVSLGVILVAIIALWRRLSVTATAVPDSPMNAIHS